MYIDPDKLRNDMTNDSLGAFIGGGFGGSFVEGCEISKMSDKELVDYAMDKGYDISKYEV